MTRQHHEMSEEETQHFRKVRRRNWTAGSLLALLGSIAAIAVAWPQVSQLIHWSVGLMDAPDQIKQMQARQDTTDKHIDDGFSSVNNNLRGIKQQLRYLERTNNWFDSMDVNTNKQLAIDP